MVYVLDTDHLAHMRHESQASSRLTARLDHVPADALSTTIISYQEQMRGWLAYLNDARSSEEIVSAYEELLAMHYSFCQLNVLPYDSGAEERFVQLRKQLRRLGTLDLRIASIVLNLDATLLSRNLRDFQQIPGLKVEDWTN